jgi:hypothetical protein
VRRNVGKSVSHIIAYDFSAVFDELPFFQPKKSLYIADPEMQKGYVLYSMSLFRNFDIHSNYSIANSFGFCPSNTEFIVALE